MILKFARKCFINSHTEQFSKRLIFQFCNKKDGKGFGNFQRKKQTQIKKQQSQQSTQPSDSQLNEKKTVNENKQQFKEYQRKQNQYQQPNKINQPQVDNKEKKGFSNFARTKVNRDNSKGQKKIQSSQKINKNSSSFKSFQKLNRQKQQPKQQPKQQINQKKQQNKPLKINQSFKNFSKKTQNQFNKQINSSKPIQPQKPTENSQQKAQQGKPILNQKFESQQPHLSKSQPSPQPKPQPQLDSQSSKQMQKNEQDLKDFNQKVQNFKKMHKQKKPLPQLDQKFIKSFFQNANSNMQNNFFKKWKTIFAFLIVFLGFNIYLLGQKSRQEITIDKALELISKGKITRIIFQHSQIENKDQSVKNKKIESNLILIGNVDGQQQQYVCMSNKEFQKIVRERVIQTQLPISIQAYDKEEHNKTQFLKNALNFVMLFLFFSSFLGGNKAKGGRAGQQGSLKDLFGSQSSKMVKTKPNIRFKDVVGIQKAKDEIVEFVDFLKNFNKYQKLGAKIPRGALLTGPPGTGKTLLAKACAGQSQAKFFAVSGSQFIQKYVGVGAQRVRQLFKQARQNAPAIIFIDEIDAIGKKRAAGFGGGNDERDTTLNQLLVQMDGFQKNDNVVVFAATNQRQVLDPALTRPGRFDRLIQVDLPDLQGRRQIFMVHLTPIILDQKTKSKQQYAKRMATLTPGFSGADIKNLCNEAAIMAARNDKNLVTIEDFEQATERVIGGVEKKSHLITEQTKKVTAYHECGHGVVSWFLEGANPLLKLTIIPRSKGSLGFAQYLPHENQISTKMHLEDQICVILSGRITEQIFFSKISTGAYDDLQKAYKIAKMIVTQYGMNDKLGWLSYEQSEYTKFYSKQTQKTIDEQILKIIQNCTERARKIIIERRQLIQKLAKKLLQVETIDLSTISQILGQRPFKPKKQYEEYLSQHKRLIEQKIKNAIEKEKESKEQGQGQGQGKKNAADGRVNMKAKLTDYIL